MGPKCVLVTGGAGYIGSHTVIELLNSTDYSVVVIDNLINSKSEAIKRAETITGRSIPFYISDLRDSTALTKIFDTHSIYCVIHFAGLKAVGESCKYPLRYYQCNLGAALTLIEVMEAHNVRNFIFSSSATVYGEPHYLPLDEKHPTGACTNPYGRTKYFIEQILDDVAGCDERWNVIKLRYFNPVGAHISGTLGENPQGIPNNLMPFVAQVAIGTREHLNVFGDDYDTVDGTGVRDYIHVVDLAKGHIAAINKINSNCRLKVYNLGTGRPQSVLQMVQAFEKATGKTIPYKITARRSGDTATMYADPTLAEKELNWTADKDVDEMCRDTWRWQTMNPYGFENPPKDAQNGIDQ